MIMFENNFDYAIVSYKDQKKQNHASSHNIYYLEEEFPKLATAYE